MLVPLARMRDRYEVERQDSDASAFHCLLYVGEATVKLLVAGLLAGMLDDRDRNRYGHLHALSRADGIGEWGQRLDMVLIGPGAQFVHDAFRPCHRELSQRAGPSEWQYKAVRLLHESLSRLELEVDPLAGTIALKQWFVLFAILRNKTRGHGALLASKCAQIVPLLEESIFLLISHLSVFSMEWAYVHRNLSGKYRVTGISNDSASFDRLRKDSSENIRNGVYVWADGPRPVDLIGSDANLSDFFFANGNFRVSSYEGISYISGDKSRIDGSHLLNPASQLPDSETQGKNELDVQGNTLGNVPTVAGIYVKRTQLEIQLKHALIMGRHEIVTLGGPGGAGKTTLALEVIKKIQGDESVRFSTVIWFSARDIDLLESGPKPVRPHGVSLQDFSKEYARLTGPAGGVLKSARSDEQFSVALSGTPVGATLFVFDNFETVTSPVDLYKWLDSYIRPPNKILITTRTREFRGDFPIELMGMSEEEVSILIDSVSTDLQIADKLTSDYRRQIFDESGGHPYVVKILLGEAAKSGKLIKPQRLIATQDNILTALFERTFSVLTPSAQRIYLLLSNWRSVVPTLAVEAVVLRNASERIDVRAALDELRRLSLVEEISPSDEGESFVSVPLAAATFGQKKLNASPLKATVEADSDLIREFGAVQKSRIHSGVSSRIPPLIRALAKRISSGRERLEALEPMLHFIAHRIPQTWIEIAKLYMEEDPGAGYKKAADAMRRYIESGDRSLPEAEAWELLAAYYRAGGDIRGEIHAIAEQAGDMGKGPDELSKIADRLNHVMSNARRDGNMLLLPDEKRHLVGTLCRRLELVRSELDATDISRLAWLYLHMNDKARAFDLVQEGLALDPSNEYCVRIQQNLLSV